jgi:hypothetical protein
MPEIMEIQMLDLLREFDGKLKDNIHEDIRDLIVHGEWGIALENLCQQLYEYDVAVPPNSLTEIKKLTEQMQLPSKTWSFLGKC